MLNGFEVLNHYFLTSYFSTNNKVIAFGEDLQDLYRRREPGFQRLAGKTRQRKGSSIPVSVELTIMGQGIGLALPGLKANRRNSSTSVIISCMVTTTQWWYMHYAFPHQNGQPPLIVRTRGPPAGRNLAQRVLPWAWSSMPLRGMYACRVTHDLSSGHVLYIAANNDPGIIMNASAVYRLKKNCHQPAGLYGTVRYAGSVKSGTEKENRCATAQHLESLWKRQKAWKMGISCEVVDVQNFTAFRYQPQHSWFSQKQTGSFL